MERSIFIVLVFGLFLTSSAIADDVDTAKKNAISRFTNSIAEGLENIIGGEGDTEIQITAGEHALSDTHKVLLGLYDGEVTISQFINVKIIDPRD